MNQKLKAIASFIDKKDVVLDTCCDHAYLAIYLKKNKLCKNVFASDINIHALEGARKNIKQANVDIQTYLSDGFLTISNDEIDTVVIAGVGTSTVLHILDSTPEKISKFIISSNNHQEELRKELYQRKLYIEKEIVVFEKNKVYVIMLVTKEKQQENRLSLKYGKSNNKEYFKYLLGKEKEVLEKIPKNKIFMRFHCYFNIKELKWLIKRK